MPLGLSTTPGAHGGAAGLPAAREAHTPYVVEDALSGPLSAWTLPHLAERLGDRRVHTKVVPGDGNVEYRHGGGEMPFREVVDAVLAPVGDSSLCVPMCKVWTPGAFHVRYDSPTAGLLDELADDVLSLPLVGAMQLWEVNLWVSGGFMRTGLHFDSHENLMLVLEGEKTFYCFDPEDTAHLYPASLSAVHPASDHVSEVVVTDGYLDRFPRLRDARCTEVRIQAGQAGYIPAGWWHIVETPRANLGVSYWWMLERAKWTRHLRAPLNRVWLRKAHLAALRARSLFGASG